MNFFDTCALMVLQQEAFKSEFYICNVTISELEHIKTSNTKSEEVKWQASKVVHLLDENPDKYTVIMSRESKAAEIAKEYDLDLNNDLKIISTALMVNTNTPITFVTGDFSCKNIATMLDLKTTYTNEDMLNDKYCGYKEIKMSGDEMAKFYGHEIINNLNSYDLLENEYLLIKDDKDAIVDKYKWTAEGYIKLAYRHFNSEMYGKVTPKDEYQALALDTIMSNQISMLRGPAGSGKSYLAFGYLFSLLERGKIDKIIIFTNTVATKGSARLGFYPGTREEKLMDSQIGNFLSSKLGDRYVMEELIEQEKLLLLPMSDVRGFDTSNMNAGIYITEAQNMDVSLMKLALQRVGEDCICILDGDDKCQVDMSGYAGIYNGLKRASQVFRGHDCYGEVTLKNIYRSKIANIAEQL